MLGFRLIRRAQNLRLFSSKNPSALRKQFEKLKTMQEKRLTEKEDSEPQEEETQHKSVDPKLRKQQLKDKFKHLKEDLAKESGEAKSWYQRLNQAYSNFQMPELKAPQMPELKAPQMPDFKKMTSSLQQKLAAKRKQSKPEDKKAQTTAKAEPKPQDTKTEKQEDQAKEKEAPPKIPLSQKYPKLQPVFYYSNIVKDYTVDAIRETFPTKQYKLEKIQARQEKLKAEREFLEKVEKGEIEGDDENIPEWKKGALLTVEEKKSAFQKLKDRIRGTKIEETIDHTSSKLNKSEALKAAKEGYKGVKTELHDMKETIKEDIEDSDSQFVQKTRETAGKAFMETTEAKAVKLIRAMDPEFDVFEFENQLEDMILDAYRLFTHNKQKELKEIATGQALHFFTETLESKELEEGQAFSEVYDMAKPVFLGVNLEEKNRPKFSYNCIIREFVFASDNMENTEEEAKQTQEEENLELSLLKQGQRGDLSEKELKDTSSQSGEFTRTSFNITLVWNSDFDPAVHNHPWNFIGFQPVEDTLRLG